jgi:Alpha/beta hydrolase domain
VSDGPVDFWGDMSKRRSVASKFLWSLMCALIVSAVASAPAFGDAASSTVTPVPGTPIMHGHANYDMAEIGYVQKEFFFEGTADAYGATTTPLATDGKWTTAPSHQAAYKTRMVVNRPIDDDDFNGTVFVEWFNVSGQADGSPFWQQTHVELLRRGYAYVAVSAQAVGVNQLKCPAAPPLPPGCLAPGNPDRYGSLIHPGDSFSYDIFSQAGQAILDDAAVVLDGLEPERLIAGGESQSAGRMVTYINGVHPLVDVYDGFLVYSRGSSGAALRQAPQVPAITAPAGTQIRDDLNAPVLVFQTETDVGGLSARQDDSPMFRLWEVAGTAHFDQYGLAISRNDVGERASTAEWFDSMRNPSNSPDPTFEEIFGPCNEPINTGPATFVLRAAVAHLNRWIIDGTPPPTAPRLEVNTPLPPPPGVVPYAQDANGNVLGGIRTPAVDAPVAKLSGFGQTGNNAPFCGSFGTTVPFTQEQLNALYKNHGGFVGEWKQATGSSLTAGFLVAEDANDMTVIAAQSDIGKK